MDLPVEFFNSLLTSVEKLYVQDQISREQGDRK